MHRRDFVLTLPLAASVALAIRNVAAQQTGRPATAVEATGARRMTEAAVAFLAALPVEQRRALSFPLEAPERAAWSNLPIANVSRAGVRLGDLDPGARRRLHALLRASASSQGYAKITGIMQLDDILRADELAYMQNNPPRPRAGRAAVESMGSGSYFVAVFGNPGTDDRWGWLITGHHLGATFTRAGDRVTFMPMFLGASPNEIQAGPHAGAQVLSHEASRGYEFLRALTPDQRAVAILSAEAINDVMTGVGRRDSLSRFEGLPASALDPVQQRLLWALVEEYVRNADFEAADAQLDAIRAAGLDTLHFSWRGPTDDPSAPFYYRVHGPRIIIEFALQEPNHVHTVVRDPTNDYGADWLGIHYQEHAARR